MADPEELEYVGRFDSGDILAEFDGRPFHDREISAVYVYRKPVDAAALKLQEEEVDAVKWMPVRNGTAGSQGRRSGFLCERERIEAAR